MTPAARVHVWRLRAGRVRLAFVADSLAGALSAIQLLKVEYRTGLWIAAADAPAHRRRA